MFRAGQSESGKRKGCPLAQRVRRSNASGGDSLDDDRRCGSHAQETSRFRGETP
jgi:hypothetical protein